MSERYKLVPVEPTAEMTDLIKRLRIKAGMIELGEIIAWGSDSALMREAADVLERAGSAPAVQGEPVGWQFYQVGKWWHGDDRIKDHRKNIEEMGFRVRDVYAAPQPPPCQECGGDGAGGEHEEDCAMAQPAEQQPPPDVARLLNRIIPRIDAVGPDPLDPDIHCCEWTLHIERERIHAEFAHFLAAHRKQDAAGLTEGLTKLYECSGCGHLYQAKISRCDCMPKTQKFNVWFAYPKKRDR